ncbi:MULTISPECIES: hypothetical protein [unclassified Pseudomonas]|uniref:hypothetical protein n=1 Tax=unclassified Pseudomonas TaxID=196821 RepID=UPI00069EFB6F|nr:MULTISPECIES: hypothetical protein [unclassified Pseudomonas]WPN46046.1 hypothetical protein QMK58_23230 [Pseudomonas sp. P8_241]
MVAHGPEHATWLCMETLALNIPNARTFDFPFWPVEYFGDRDNSRELTPEQIIETALKNSDLQLDAENLP